MDEPITQQFFSCSKCKRTGFRRKQVRISAAGVILCNDKCAKEADAEAQAKYITEHRDEWNEYQRGYYARTKKKGN